MVTISLPAGFAFFRQRVDLDGTAYQLDFAWNARAGTWRVGLYDEEGTPLMLDIVLVCNTPLLRKRRWKVGMPAGELFAIDQTSTIEAPDFDQLGTDVELTYFTADDMAELRAS